MMLMTMLYNFLDTAFNSALGPVDLEDIWKSLRLMLEGMQEEAAERAERLGFQVGDKEGLFRQVERITALWCGMLSKYGEITFTYEFAYGADYVIRRNGKLPPPEFPQSQGLLFPTNYPDFRYW